ncbi:hypothetical protein [Chitinibacter sp. ZOR0017]|uniref:hypothetical protein n=1 Tax=Chitinibacter sp. ZOR0017 TaxID=1339254 RepID=UPI0012E02FD1|nr:hypothetical protein [Chitinibacter sp. ZOR0017]
MNSLSKIALAAILVVGMLLAQAQSLLTYPPRHQLATDLAPQLQAVLPQATVRAFNGQLIISAPDESTLTQARQLLQALDQRSKMLRISVRQSELSATRQWQVGVDGVLRWPGESELSLNANAEQNRQQRNLEQTLSVVEGGEAMISLGLQRFIPQLTFRYRPGYQVQSYGGQWQSVDNGFYAQAHTLGERVRVRLHPYSATIGRDGVVQQQQAYSEVEGRLSEWLPVGETRQEASSDRRRINGVDQQETQASYVIWLKVEVANAN